MSEPIGTESKIVHTSPENLLKETSEALRQVAKKYPGVAFIVLLGPKSDASSLACLTTVPGPATIERLRHGLDQAKRDGRRLHIPFRE